MSHKGDIYEIGDRKILLVRGIFDYFEKRNFSRLKEEYERARGLGAEFYIALYSDSVLEMAGHDRKLKGLVSDEDRVFMLESLDFIDGAFIIDTPKTREVENGLKAKLLDQENSREEKKSIHKNTI